MKGIKTKTSLAFLILGALTFIGCKPSRDSRLMSGAAETVITQVKDRPDVYDDLYARALVLAEDSHRLAIVTVDIGTFDNTYFDLLLNAINKATGIPAENIIINTSQTHNAPGVDGRVLSQLSKDWLAGSISDLVKNATDNLQPATLTVGRAPVQIGYNRRLMKDAQIVMEPNPGGAIVPWVDVLGAYDQDGKQIAVLFSHAAHPVIIHASSKAIGPDFPGYAVKHLRNLLSKEGEPDGVFMFAQGCCGNINGYPLRGGFAACDAAGLSLAFATTQALSKDQDLNPGFLKARSMSLSLPLQDPPSVDECKEILAREPDNQCYQDLLNIAESGEPQFMSFPMRALAIGEELCILALTGEMFAEYQLWLDEASPFKHTFVFSHTNGLTGYIATRKDYELGSSGGYEAWYHPNSSPPWLSLRPSAEQLIREGILRLLSELKSDRD